MSAGGTEAMDPALRRRTALLDLVASLASQSASHIQTKINLYLASECDATMSFLVMVSEDEEELMLHVIGSQELPSSLKIPVSNTSFSEVLRFRRPVSLSDLDSDPNRDLWKLLGLTSNGPASSQSQNGKQEPKGERERTPELGITKRISRALFSRDSEGKYSNAEASPNSHRRSNSSKDSSRRRQSLQHQQCVNQSPKRSPGSPAYSKRQSSPHINSNLTRQSTKEAQDELAKKRKSSLVRQTSINTETLPEADTSRCRMPERFHAHKTLKSQDSLASTRALVLSSLGSTPPTSFLCVPVPHPGKIKLAVLACLLDKKTSSEFNPTDIETVQECFRYTLGMLLNTLAWEHEQRARKQCQSLLSVAKNIFIHLDDLTQLLQEIMSEARYLTDAERCSLFLLDKENSELVAKVFDGESNEEATGEVRLPTSQGIAGHVVTTGQLLNIRDAYSHPLFFRGFDDCTGFKTRNILCFPIKENDEVIGVAELCNKISGRYFTSMDEEIAMAFSIYCGISITHSLMYKKVCGAHNRSQLANELMVYHMRVTDDEVRKLSDCEVPSVFDFDHQFCSFKPKIAKFHMPTFTRLYRQRNRQIYVIKIPMGRS